MQTKLILVRHGQTQLGHALIGKTDVGLSKLGEQQVEHALASISDVDLIISSPMQRCLTSATDWADAQNTQLAVEPNWREMDFGDWDGLAFEQLYKPHSDFILFSQDPNSMTPPNGESVATFSERVIAALHNWLHDIQGKTCVVLTHGGVIRTLLNWAIAHPHAGGIPVSRLAIDHASQTIINVYHEQQQDQAKYWPRVELINWCAYPASLHSQHAESRL